MKNKKGFTLMELMTVIIIIGILISLSVPFVIGYARDARNDRAKTNLYLIAQGYKNFRTDFPWVNVNTITKVQSVAATHSLDATSCNVSSFTTGSQPTANYENLIKCSYIANAKYDDLKYNFYLGSGKNDTTNRCSACPSMDAADVLQPILACMVGADGAPYDGSYCAFIDSNNVLRETPVATETNNGTDGTEGNDGNDDGNED